MSEETLEIKPEFGEAQTITLSENTPLISMKEMCETIVRADILRFDDGSSPTAEQIFNSSPSGELFQVIAWYEMAKQEIALRNSVDGGKSD